MGPLRNIYKGCARIMLMVYTEVKEKNGGKYYYRVRSVREGVRFRKERIYLGKNLSGENLSDEEKKADKKLMKKKIDDGLVGIRSKIIKVLKKNKVKRAGIFGSYARGEQRKNSDVDILIQPPKGIGFGFVGIEFELAKVLGKKVDLVSYKYLSPYIKNDVLSEEVRII